MPTVTAFEREKREVETILASGIFNRAPNLAHLLKYVCTKYFEGAAREIKEYNIAVEALGRPAEFDQKRDSIVRVEAHRLRKRLKEYYEREGADHEIHIQIPSGQYTPHFVTSAVSVVEPSPGVVTEDAALPDPTDPPQSVIAAAEWAVEPAPVELSEQPPTSLVTLTESHLPPISGPPAESGTRPRRRLWFLAAVVVLLGTAIIVLLDHSRNASEAGIDEPPVAADASKSIRILAGVENGSYVDAFERTWQSDRYFSGGYVTQSPRTHPVTGTRDHRIYQNRREGGFQYNIPLTPGTYELKLYFAETVFGENNVAGGGETTRIFDVSMNGKPLMATFDVINDAGSGAADVKVFKDVSPASDGKLHLNFTPETNPAFVNAIEIVPSMPGKMLPIRIVARDRGFKDSQNRYWDPDRYAQGGLLIARPESNVAGADPELFRSERFGNITYAIPVPQPGRYGVTLYFAENWFGPGNPGSGGIGSRVFDILINGVAVRRNFDIFRESGGVGHFATVALHGLESNHQGKVVIALIPARNYACINALEIIDESK
jgi:hypothetical protein